jgi:large subunit ribosomal protein L4
MNQSAPKVSLHKFEGGKGEEVSLDPTLFSGPVNKDLLYRAVRTYLMNLRQGTHATKTRSLVAGGGKKPWPQKHTGNARHGSRRSPIWRKGGIVFGPHPKEYNYGLPKKMQRGALRSALVAKLQEQQLHVMDKISYAQPKTKEGVKLLSGLGFPKRDKYRYEVLIVVSQKEYSQPVKKTFANLPWAKCVETNHVTTYDILKYENLLVTQQALPELEARCKLA